ncbi:unnamed protein product [Adineta steineri]|uniref:14-3-3 domain-containing protein n=1 Tax=Adineta steineri TaxID=433720 RepID=A0A813WQT3_9BILA|nr:unnamed protein product [Adineta steineri]
MLPLPKVLVTKVKRHRRHSITHHSKKGRVSNVVRVTRIKSRLDGSFRTNRQSVPSVSKINMSIADVNIKSTLGQEVKNNVNQPQILQSTMTNSAVPLISSVARQSTLPNRFSSKVVPSNSYDPLRSTVHSNLSSVLTKKQSRFSLAEATTGSEQQKFAGESEIAYKDAFDMAKNQMPVTHPIRLGLVLNFSVFYYEILNDTDTACRMAKQAFDDALAELDSIGEDSYRDSTIIMQLLRDNLTVWTNNPSDGNDVNQSEEQ